MTGFGSEAGAATGPSSGGASTPSGMAVSVRAGVEDGWVDTLAHPPNINSNAAETNMQYLCIN
jgi:hypothetical protein